MAKGTVRRSRTGNSRLSRTILLAAAALGAGLFWLGRQSEVAAADLTAYALTSLLWLALPVLVAGLCFAAFVALRWLLRSKKRNPDERR